jgi:tetratricopeptide (TPR) repeat protein
MARFSPSLVSLALALSLPAVVHGQSPTFAQDVAPLLSKHCVACHQAKGDAPFSLVTYEEVRRHARQIAEVTVKRYMPPWKPDSTSPTFVGERRLNDDEIAIFGQWAAAGAPEGFSTLDHESIPSTGGWLSGEPDMVLTLPTYTLRADGLDVFRNFVVTVPGGGTRYVRGLQFRPRSRAVHHANIRVDPTPASRALDEADPAPGYDGMILHSAEYPDGHFLGWTPGQLAPPSNELAWRLNGGSDLVVQLHMRPTGRPEKITPLIGLYFTDQSPTRFPTMLRLGRQNLDIAAGLSDYRVADSFVLPVDVQVVAIQPHAHYRAREVRALATSPDGVRHQLISIPDWDFNWQDQYRFAQPLWLPAGTTLDMSFAFDNSADNPRNPSDPPEQVTWGWRSSDEMADVWIQMFTRSDADREALVSATRRKMTLEDAVGAEVLVAREPNHIDLRNDAALIYQELGRPDRALVHFSAVTRLQPRSPSAHYNRGVTLEALGRLDEAAAEYTESTRLDPSYARAHVNLANLHYASRRLDDAVAAYQNALRYDRTNVDARCSMARVLTELDRPSDAVTEYRTALVQRPDSIPCLINFAWLLSAHHDGAIRQPEQAVAMAKHAMALTGLPTAEGLDVLGAAYASAGHFDAAIQVAMDALRLLEHSLKNELAQAVHERLDLYRRQVPFVVPE